MHKPHIRKVDTSTGREVYHCTLQRSDVNWWHEYGETWRIALDKMEARMARYEYRTHDPISSK